MLYSPFKLISGEEIEKIHATTLKILGEVGHDVLSEKARERFARAGAMVEGERVRIPPELVEEALAGLPPTVRLAGRQGRQDCLLDGRITHFSSGLGINMVDLKTGERRPCTLEDIRTHCRLTDALENVDIVYLSTVASDLSDHVMHANKAYAALSNSAKPFINSSNSLAEVKEMVKMAEVLAGGEDELRNDPFIGIVVAVISPLTLGSETAETIMFLAEKGLPQLIVSAPIGGCTSPLSIAGTSLIHNCEVIAGLTLAQLSNPGTPVIYGGLPSISNPKDLSYATGAVEVGIMSSIASQMSTRYRAPFSAYGLTDSKIADAQSGYEKALFVTLMATSLRVDLIISGGGGEGALSYSHEQLVVDNEIFGMIRRLQRGIDLSDDALGLEAIMRVGPGGNFLTADHTLCHMQNAVYFPTLSDRVARPDWLAAGAKDARQRAKEKAQAILKSHQSKAISGDVDRRIRKAFEGIV